MKQIIDKINNIIKINDSLPKGIDNLYWYDIQEKETYNYTENFDEWKESTLSQYKILLEGNSISLSEYNNINSILAVFESDIKSIFKGYMLGPTALINGVSITPKSVIVESKDFYSTLHTLFKPMGNNLILYNIYSVNNGYKIRYQNLWNMN